MALTQGTLGESIHLRLKEEAKTTEGWRLIHQKEEAEQRAAGGGAGGGAKGNNA